MVEKQNFLSHRGLTSPKTVLRRLNEVGIFAQAKVSLEHQHLARRHVVRGIESGGAVGEIGRYVTFCGPTGEALPYLHPIDAIGVNGVHAVVVAPVLIRIELFRTGRTCQLLITQHEPEVENGRLPELGNRVLFCGVDGLLDAGQADKENDLSSSAMPQFWSRAGEERQVPVEFESAVRAAIKGVHCIGCSHAHYLVAGVSSKADAMESGSKTARNPQYVVDRRR